MIEKELTWKGHLTQTSPPKKMVGEKGIFLQIEKRKKTILERELCFQQKRLGDDEEF